MLKATWTKYRLQFKFEARTSRSVMHHKDTYFVHVADDSNPACVGVGECNLFAGLSADDVPDYEDVLNRVCSDNSLLESVMRGDYSRFPRYSSMIFGFETAFADLKHGGVGVVYPCKWLEGQEYAIPINGLVWMGDKPTMRTRIREKIDSGFRTLKLKIGGIDFDDEVDLLRCIRQEFSTDELTLRLDANGAFSPENALSRLETLSRFSVHSIEQPIRAGQFEAMARIIMQSPIAVALDEELIGCRTFAEKEVLLDALNPHYIILKPALCGGFVACDEWLALSQAKGIGVWATSALESNVGLNAIAQWTSSRFAYPMIAQGLGTGNLYENNLSATFATVGDKLVKF